MTKRGHAVTIGQHGAKVRVRTEGESVRVRCRALKASRTFRGEGAWLDAMEYAKALADEGAQSIHPKCPWPILAKAGAEAIVTIYGLVESSTPDQVWYVGQSISPRRRFEQHIRETMKGMGRVHGWVREVLADGKEVWMVELERTSRELANQVELDWILRMWGAGQAPLNMVARDFAAAKVPPK